MGTVFPAVGVSGGKSARSAALLALGLALVFSFGPRAFAADLTVTSGNTLNVTGASASLLPTTAAPAWPVDRDCPETIGGKPGNGGTQAMFCGWVNAVGFAGLNVPGLPHPDGRPIGLQIVAPFGLDGVALEIGRQIEARASWAQRWPALAENAA